MADLRIVDAPVLLQESITDDVKMSTGGLGNYALRLGDLLWYVVTKENLASKSYVDTSSKGVQDKLDIHVSDKTNPHQVTKQQVGLGNVDNTADIDKPVSNAVNSAIITATTDMATKTYVNQKDNLKADKATTLNGYGITDAYTKDEINTSISLKADTSYVNSKSGDLTTLTTTDKSSLVKAVNEVYDKTAIFYNTVADMVADTQLKAGKAVITHGFYAANDGGGARYLISSTATDYSIPVANGLHAVFADSFDIRKFGIISSATQDQTTNLVRMRNYADTRVYTIDFLNFDIVVPNSNAGIAGSCKVANGLWFEQAHHIKNLSITVDKSKRLETGKCCLIFCPTANPSAIQEVFYENITLDCWNDNYQPRTENYLGTYDGMRHGIFIHPKGHWHALDSQYDATKASNYIFRFKNIKFKSQAYSYNITQGAVRSKKVVAENISGDCFLMINLDTLNLDAKSVSGNVRLDRLESGRLMVNDVIHFEPEQTGVSGLYVEIISLNKCAAMRTNTDGSQEKGQLLWITATAATPHKQVIIDNSTGTVSLGRSVNTYDNLIINNCIDGIYPACHDTTIKNVFIANSVINKYKNNPGIPHPFSNTAIDLLEFDNVTLNCSFYNEPTSSTPFCKKVKFTDCRSNKLDASSYLFTGMCWSDVELKNCDFTAHTGLLSASYNLQKLLINSSKIGNAGQYYSIALRYFDSSGSTDAKIINTQWFGDVQLAGTLNFYGCSWTSTPAWTVPIYAQYVGINTITTTIDNLSSPILTQKFNVNQSVAANSSATITKTVKDFCKSVGLHWVSDPGVNVSTAIYGTTVKITLTNNTASAITVNSDVTLTQIV